MIFASIYIYINMHIYIYNSFCFDISDMYKYSFIYAHIYRKWHRISYKHSKYQLVIQNTPKAPKNISNLTLFQKVWFIRIHVFRSFRLPGRNLFFNCFRFLFLNCFHTLWVGGVQRCKIGATERTYDGSEWHVIESLCLGPFGAWGSVVLGHDEMRVWA